MNDSPELHLSTFLPLVTGTDGQPYINCLAVVILLQHYATKIRTAGPDAALKAAADFLDAEADALNIRTSPKDAP